MADENGKQTETESRPWHQTVTLLLVSLRLAALVATSTAAGLMAFNKETKTITVVVVGTNPILQSFTAAFQQTPAFVSGRALSNYGPRAVAQCRPPPGPALSFLSALSLRIVPSAKGSIRLGSNPSMGLSNSPTSIYKSSRYLDFQVAKVKRRQENKLT
ncbi:hypothetical protein ZIOFF_030501 [Zingiber officinale]|uniref:CASP-like protein n=1 Tax=Zingiber officinale TaxID=94328 RepID=A0A8J5GRA4_ZINOF|nr:hypothetical protein ZIOFF_030501 [Zingiber officinale]